MYSYMMQVVLGYGHNDNSSVLYQVFNVPVIIVTMQYTLVFCAKIAQINYFQVLHISNVSPSVTAVVLPRDIYKQKISVLVRLIKQQSET